LISAFAIVVVRQLGQLDKHQHFSMNKNNIRLKLKSNKQPLDMPIKGVAFSSDLISADS